MEIISTSIPAVKLIKLKVFGDNRSFFMETLKEQGFPEAGVSVCFVQNYHSWPLPESILFLVSNKDENSATFSDPELFESGSIN